MNITLLPFYSQQNKTTGRFMIDKCCVSRINDYYARRLADLGHRVQVVVPVDYQCEPYTLFNDIRLSLIHQVIPQDNVGQRLHFNTYKELFLKDQDIVISHNEIQSALIKRLVPHVYVIQFNHLLPIGPNLWFKDLARSSWRAADLVIVLSDLLKQWILGLEPKVNIDIWPTVFPAFEKQTGIQKDIDILFVQRCSSSNYTRHLEFLEALKILKNSIDLRVVFTDSTNYLQQTLNDNSIERANADSRVDYEHLLQRAKYSIALMSEDLHGGVAVREAIFAGSVPIFSRTPAYQHLLKDVSYAQELFVDLEPEKMALQLRSIVLNELYLDHDLKKQLQETIVKDTFDLAFDNSVIPALEKIKSLRN